MESMICIKSTKAHFRVLPLQSHRPEAVADAQQLPPYRWGEWDMFVQIYVVEYSLMIDLTKVYIHYSTYYLL